MRWWLSSSGLILFVSACAGTSSTTNCEVAVEPESVAIAPTEPSAAEEEQIVHARWIARGDADDFEWLESRIHARLDQSPRDLARWAELARLHIDRAVRDEDSSALARVALILADADRIGGGSAQLEIARGLLAQLEGRHDHAVAAWQRAVDLDPMSSEAHLRLGIACLEHRDFGRARVQLEAHVELEPEDADGWLALGVAYAHTSERELASAAYLRAAELDPEDPRPHWNLAWMGQDWNWIEHEDELYAELHRTREHLDNLFVTAREHPMPGCEPVFLPDPECVAEFEQHEQLIFDATELEATTEEMIATIEWNSRPHYPAISAMEAKAEAERRKRLLEMEKAAADAAERAEEKARSSQIPEPG